MIHPKLVSPKSIVIVGGSDNLHTPGGRVIDNLLKNRYSGKLFVVNRKGKPVRNLPVFRNVSELPGDIDLAIISIPAKFVLEVVQILIDQKNTRGFIVFSAGFGDYDEQGKERERKLVEIIERVGGSLLGPNNIGLMNTHFTGVFTRPVPPLASEGIDLISASGATAVFILEAAMQIGLRFNSVWSVGNSAQIGVEEVLEYLDEQYSEGAGKVIMLYLESISRPQKLLRSALSLGKKGCKIVAIKSGTSQAGSRAASSHTGALANSDLAVSTLFEKAGIIRAEGRNEMILLAGILQYGLPEGNNIAIITHAGGPAVMLTDVLEKNGFKIPEFSLFHQNQLKEKLYPGSSVNNPVDFLATGTAGQLDFILEQVTNFSETDAISVIFGSPGLFPVFNVYDVLHKHIKNSEKPIYPILPSVINVGEEIKYFQAKGNISFPEETLFGRALAKAYYSSKGWDSPEISRKDITFSFSEGYLSSEKTSELLRAFGFSLPAECFCVSEQEAIRFAENNFPVVMKVTGLLHKSDVGGVRLNVQSLQEVSKHFTELMQIQDAKGVLVQKQEQGKEMFIGIQYEENFGHLLFFGLGGIYIEVFKDFATVLFPASKEEIYSKLKKLKGYALLEGVRGEKKVSISSFVDTVYKMNKLIASFPNICEADFNPVLVNSEGSILVDARVKFVRQRSNVPK